MRPVPFFRVGNHPALDFVNTLAADAAGPLELLHTDADLWRWARGSELAGRLEAGARGAARLDPAVPRLRAALRQLFLARIDGGAPPRAALEQLNEVLAWPAPAPQL